MPATPTGDQTTPPPRTTLSLPSCREGVHMSAPGEDTATCCDGLVGEESTFEIRSSPSPAKMQSSSEDSQQPPPSVEEETDPRSKIEWYKYDSDVEDDRDGMHEMTEKESEEYYRQIDESNGFDVMCFPRSFAIGKIEPILNIDRMYEKLKTLSELALTEYNGKDEERRLKFVKIVKANGMGCAGVRYYITFEVKDADAKDGDATEFQAHVWDGLHETKVLMCRPKISTQSRCD